MAKKYHKLSAILKQLLFNKNMKAVDLSREVNLPQPTVHRLVTGKSTRPYRTSLEPIAKFFSISVEQLLGEEPLEKQRASTALAEHKVVPIPVISWSDLDSICDAIDQATQQIAVTYPVSDKTFSLVMLDSSMEPLFSRETLLIFDMGVKPQDRSFVLVKRNTANTYIFRQLLLDADQKYIKSLNVDLSASKIQPLFPEDEIIACLVEARKNFLPTVANQIFDKERLL